MKGQIENRGLEAVVDCILLRTGFDEFVQGEDRKRLYGCLEDYLPIPSITEADTHLVGYKYFVFREYSLRGKELKERCKTDSGFLLPRILMGEASVWVIINNKEVLLEYLKKRRGLFSKDIYAKTLSFHGADLADYSGAVDDVRYRYFLLERAVSHLRESIEIQENGGARLASLFTYMALTRALVRRFKLGKGEGFLEEARGYYSKALLRAKTDSKVIFEYRREEIEAVLGQVE